MIFSCTTASTCTTTGGGSLCTSCMIACGWHLHSLAPSICCMTLVSCVLICSSCSRILVSLRHKDLSCMMSTERSSSIYVTQVQQEGLDRGVWWKLPEKRSQIVIGSCSHLFSSRKERRFAFCSLQPVVHCSVCCLDCFSFVLMLKKNDQAALAL